MKITKNQLRRIIREEKAILLREMNRDAMMDLEARERAGDVKQNAEKVSGDLKLLATVIDNLTEMALGYDADEEMRNELRMQVELLNDVYSSIYNTTTG